MENNLKENIFNYCLETFYKYNEDQNIFYKAIQIIEYVENQNSLPYSLKELNNALVLLLGASDDQLKNVIIPKVLQKHNGSEDLVWNSEKVLTTPGPASLGEKTRFVDLESLYGKEIVQNFINDITIFSNTVYRSQVFNLYSSFSNLQELRTIEWLSADSTHNTIQARLIRADNKYIDLSMTDTTKNLLKDMLSFINPGGTNGQ